MENLRSRSRIPLVALTLGVGAAGFLMLRHRVTQKPTQVSAVRETAAAPVLVEAVTVKQMPVQSRNTLSGQIEPSHIATLSAEVANRLERRLVNQGDHVAAGQVIAVLDSATASAILAQSQAAYEQASAARRQAETDYARAVVETDAARQQARAQVGQALADKRRAEAQVAQATAGERKARSYTRAQELRQAEDALAQAQTEERLAKIEHTRTVYLVQQGAVAQQMLDRAVTTLESATAHRQSAEQAVSLAKEGARQEDQDAAKAQVAAASAQYDTAVHQIDVARAGLRSAETRDTRLAVIRRQIEGLKAQEAAAREAVRQAQIALDKHTLRAPFAGRILATFADGGDMLAVGTPVVRIGEIGRVKAIFSVPEASRPALRLNQPITLTADALLGKSFTGQITALGFQADAKSRAFPIEITVSNGQETLLPNMVVRLGLEVGQTTLRTLILASAIATDGAQPYVCRLVNGRAERRTVTLGAPHGEYVEVLQGLMPGDQIAAAPQHLTGGDKVTTLAANLREGRQSR